MFDHPQILMPTRGPMRFQALGGIVLVDAAGFQAMEAIPDAVPLLREAFAQFQFPSYTMRGMSSAFIDLRRTIGREDWVTAPLVGEGDLIEVARRKDRETWSRVVHAGEGESTPYVTLRFEGGVRPGTVLFRDASIGLGLSDPGSASVVGSVSDLQEFWQERAYRYDPATMSKIERRTFAQWVSSDRS